MNNFHFDSTGAKIRVASIHWGFVVGGIAKYAHLIDQVTEIAPIDIKSVCILGRGWSCDEETCSKIASRNIHVKSRFDPSWMPSTSKALRDIQPHLILTHAFNGHFVSMVMDRIYGHKARKICSYHGLYHPPSRNRKLFEALFNRLTEFYIRKHAMGCVSVTHFSKDYLIERRISPEKVTVIHNGIDGHTSVSEKARIRLRAEWKINPSDIVLGVASRLDPVKGVKFLIDAFEAVTHLNPSVRLVIVGTGNQHAELEQHVRRLNLETRVVFTGFRCDVDECLSAFDIFVLPSLAEYHSIALLEAMRAKKPIIATSVGGNGESVRHEKEALLVPPADVAALKHAIQALVNDADLREVLAESAYNRFYRNFTTDVMVQKTADWIMRYAP